ncbi:competence type IV pilus minor pilin ComGG [Metabacillus sp. Hm71]|uniref:competence type IV pilus minor pilin ComGG n=1 Tax=Metabacillus sp. Hm71 TaxID=3450743 RepID=UPI003F42C72E
MRNEKGFIFPTTLGVILFCLFIVAYISSVLISEKQFYSETKQYYILENLMQLAVDQSLLEIKSQSATPIMSYQSNTINGSLSYEIKKLSPSIYEVHLTCKTIRNKVNKARYQFDLSKNEMILWSEY